MLGVFSAFRVLEVPGALGVPGALEAFCVLGAFSRWAHLAHLTRLGASGAFGTLGTHHVIYRRFATHAAVFINIGLGLSFSYRTLYLEFFYLRFY